MVCFFLTMMKKNRKPRKNNEHFKVFKNSTSPTSIVFINSQNIFLLSVEDRPQQQTTAFNMSVNTLFRINLELSYCNESRRQENLQSWYQSLINLYAEAEAYLDKEDEKKTHHDLFDQCAMRFKEYQEYVTNYEKNSQTMKVAWKPPQEAFLTFLSWEIQLRRTLDANGLLMKRGEDGISKFRKGS